jgi:catechol 2,3-dioxygenase-like lactoylglutathione lyase family enzyme
MNIRSGVALAVLAVMPAFAQLAPFNDAGVTLGHIHLLVKDVDAQKRFWTAMMDGTPVMNEQLAMIEFPGVYILFRQGEATAPPAGSIVDHFGLVFKDLPASLAKWKANGIEIEQNQNPLQGYVHAPDGVRVEFFGDPSLDAPVKMDHVHFWPVDTAAIQAWYARAFGGKPGQRPRVSTPGWIDCDFFPGANFSFSPQEKKLAFTAGRSLDHIGFEVKNLDATLMRLEGQGIRIDEGPRPSPNSKRLRVAYVTDPWGTRIELTEGLSPNSKGLAPNSK